MTEEDALQGFPLHQRIQKALTEFMGGPAPCPKGVKTITIGNLKARKWISQSVENCTPLYATNNEGRLAVEIDQIAIQAGMARPTPLSTMANSGMYHNLKERLEFLRQHRT